MFKVYFKVLADIIMECIKHFYILQNTGTDLQDVLQC